MRTQILIAGQPDLLGEDDGKFRCFYKVFLDSDQEHQEFVARLKHLPDEWDKHLAWVVEPKTRLVEAYLEISKDRRVEFFKKLNDFVHKDIRPKLPLRSRIWRFLIRPYWWWKTRKLRVKRTKRVKIACTDPRASS